MSRRSTLFVFVFFVVSSIVLFQNFTASQNETPERILLPENSQDAEPSSATCRPEEKQIALIRVKGFRPGLHAQIVWSDSANGRILAEDVTLPFSMGDCAEPVAVNEFKVCPEYMGNYFDLQIMTEDGETANLSAPIGAGCESNPYIVDVALQGGH